MPLKDILKPGIFFIGLFLFLLFSCSKPVDQPTVQGLKDSTLLIKSITHIWNGTDSITEYYSYDSVNRKINIRWQDFSGSFPSFSSADLSYTTKLLLSHIAYNYHSHSGDDRSSVDIVYDTEDILQKITINYFNGKKATIVFDKTVLPGDKYQLNWVEHDHLTNLEDDSVMLSSVYLADGTWIRSFFAYTTPTYYDANNNGSDTTLIMVTDSLIYSASGNLNKVLNNEIDTFKKVNNNYTSVEFTSRESKGDQLYNQRQALLNGIANISDITNGSDANFVNFAGILSWFPFAYESLSFTRFPFTNAKAYNYNTHSYTNSSGVSEFDSLNRLTKFSGSLNNKFFAWRITYFK